MIMNNSRKTCRVNSTIKGRALAFPILLYISLIIFSMSADANESHVIQFTNFSYNPNQLDVAVGDTIIWQGSFSAHPLQSSSIPDGAEPWGPINSGTEFSYVVQVEGMYNYDCNLHQASYGMSGSFSASVTSVDQEDRDVPYSFTLDQNYPNPFNPTTEISFILPERMHITLDVYTVNSQHITTLIDGSREAGHHSVTFDASDLPSGVYIYRLRTDALEHSKRMVYIK